MAIHHITFSSSGGAGRVAETLQKAQILEGQDAQLHVLTNTNLWVSPWEHPKLTLKSAIDHFVVANGSQPTQFSYLREKQASKLQIDFNKDDIVHLHWIAGVLGPEEILSISEKVKKVIWTTHDMLPFTGGCHHSFSCTSFQSDCANCPQVRMPFKNGISRHLKLKAEFISHINNLHVVAPTNWMADKVRQSAVFNNVKVSTIYNPISNEFFEEAQDREVTRGELGIPSTALVAIFIADDLDNPNKQIFTSMESFLESSDSTFALLVGRTKRDFSNQCNVRSLGKLNYRQLAKFAHAADLHISMSLAESSGLTIAEMAACSIPSIVLKGSGSEELAKQVISAKIVDGFGSLSQLLKNKEHLQKLLLAKGEISKISENLFSPIQVAKKYQSIYEAI